MGVYYHFWAISPNGPPIPEPPGDDDDAVDDFDPDKVADDSVFLDKPFGWVHELVWEHKESEWADVHLAIYGPPDVEGGSEENFLTPLQVVRAAAALEKVTAEMLTDYIAPKTENEKGNCQIAIDDLATLKDFYRRAAEKSHAVLLHTG